MTQKDKHLCIKQIEILHFLGDEVRGQATISRHEGNGGYPEPSAHGIQPAWGFSISHAENIRLKNVHLETILPDERPAFHFENTKKIRISSPPILTEKNGK